MKKDKQQRIEGLFEELLGSKHIHKQSRVHQAAKLFSEMKSQSLTISVVATMSSGKSTLINALLGYRLMPSKQEACTAMITEINNNKSLTSGQFKGKWLTQDGKKEKLPIVDLAVMKRLNDDSRTSKIWIEANLPFTDGKLTLIDTPGPNNSRDKSHEEVLFKHLREATSDYLLYVMTGTFGTEDEHRLLTEISQLSSAGKEGHMLFAVNKLDELNHEDGTLGEFLDKIKAYLEGIGFSNPLVFPIAALPTLKLSQDNLKGYEVNELEAQITRFNKEENFHFEEYSPVPDLTQRLSTKSKARDIAKVHMGVPCLELALHQLTQTGSSNYQLIIDLLKESHLELGTHFKKNFASHGKKKSRAYQLEKGIRSNDLNNIEALLTEFKSSSESPTKQPAQKAKPCRPISDMTEEAVTVLPDKQKKGDSVMKNVYLKYNPYKLETYLTVNGQELAQNSEIRERAYSGDTRIQEWIESLPELLVKDYNSNKFHICYHGTKKDFDDVIAVFEEANSRSIGNFTYEHQPAKNEDKDFEADIQALFSKIQQGPFEDLKSTDLKDAFEKALNSEFEVCVVATMSSGKSTLINALIGEKLMPSKQEACTAIITRIKDVSDNEGTPFRVEVYDKQGSRLKTIENVTAKEMKELNEDERVSEINMTGNLPFVNCKKNALVLIDTPGPNNSRNSEHRVTQQRMLQSSSKPLILYIMTGEFGTNDDHTLLSDVANMMKVGGKQSKDRFLFVVNKLDNRNPEEDGPVSDTLNKVRQYLSEEFDIENPNIFPVAALPALALDSYEELKGYQKTQLLGDIQKFNNEEFYFEQYSSLPKSLKKQSVEYLKNEESSFSGNPEDNPGTAFIHTGLLAVELMIKQYVDKYAYTSKIKTLVETFSKKLEEHGTIESTKSEILKNKEMSQAISGQIEIVREKIQSGNEGKKFRNRIQELEISVQKDCKKEIIKIQSEAQSEVLRPIEKIGQNDLEVKEAERIEKNFRNTVKQLMPKFQVQLERLVETRLVQSGNSILEEYRLKLASLTEELSIGDLKISALDLMVGSIPDFNLQSLREERVIGTKTVKVGQEEVRNYDKKWYKPWTWPDDKYYMRDIYEEQAVTKTVIPATKLRAMVMPVEEGLRESASSALEYINVEIPQIVQQFEEKFKSLDKVLDKKLKELNDLANEQTTAQDSLHKAELALEWLEEVQNQLNEIVEI